MALSDSAVTDLVKGRLWPLLQVERERVARIDRWMRWDHDRPHAPRQSTQEYKKLADSAQAPWGRRVVSAVTDQLYVEGYRAPRADDESPAWAWWQENGLDARQVAVHEAAVGHGLAYVVVTPGLSWLGEKMPVIRGLDRSQMVAVYEDPAWDDWPEYALRAEPLRMGDRAGWRLRFYDSTHRHNLVMTQSGDNLSYTGSEVHDIGVCPVVRFSNHLDLRGRADGDIEPIIPLLMRIDQTTFDRLVVQRFGSWKVRTIAGMAKPETQAEAEAEKFRLKVEDLLVASDPDTRFGTLDETPLDPLISAHDADVRALAALSQSPAHELIGQMANLSAEALAAAEASLQRRVIRLQHPLGVGHKQTMRLSGLVMGDEDAAKDAESQVIWRDMESRSLAQAADALGKMATMLGIPVEILWEKLPGFTQTDVERAKAIVARGGGVEELIRQAMASATPGGPSLLGPDGNPLPAGS